MPMQPMRMRSFAPADRATWAAVKVVPAARTAAPVFVNCRRVTVSDMMVVRLICCARPSGRRWLPQNDIILAQYHTFSNKNIVEYFAAFNAREFGVEPLELDGESIRFDAELVEHCGVHV